MEDLIEFSFSVFIMSLFVLAGSTTPDPAETKTYSCVSVI